MKWMSLCLFYVLPCKAAKQLCKLNDEILRPFVNACLRYRAHRARPNTTRTPTPPPAPLSAKVWADVDACAPGGIG